METITLDKKQKSFRKLGFTYLETAEIVVALKQLFANYHIHYHKLRNFHWNVESHDFFELHQEFENEYNKVQERIDIIAERIRVFGLKPAITIEETIEMSEIQQVKSNRMEATDMVHEVLKDFDILHDKMLDVLNASLEAGDNVTEQIITEFMRDLEKRNWMFTSWSKF
ncbi:DNA starvation/stationary phase protection protein [Lutimonas vermicola]|uniref:DNA starvation/stationary phase protection protein n=1 Tax=Lutimonas vermicola TaxID=414288 RepID=A0ABU9L007_9FLAO